MDSRSILSNNGTKKEEARCRPPSLARENKGKRAELDEDEDEAETGGTMWGSYSYSERGVF